MKKEIEDKDYLAIAMAQSPVRKNYREFYDNPQFRTIALLWAQEKISAQQVKAAFSAADIIDAKTGNPYPTLALLLRECLRKGQLKVV